MMTVTLQDLETASQILAITDLDISFSIFSHHEKQQIQTVRSWATSQMARNCPAELLTESLHNI